MSTDEEQGYVPVAGQMDSGWSEVDREADLAEEESRTVSYTGTLPRQVDRDNAHFVILDGSDTFKGQRFEVGTSPLVVGRSSKSDVIISDPRISSRHLQLQVIGDQLIATDLNSSNGTYLDGARVTGPVEFKTSSLLQIGHHAMRHEYRSRSEVKRESHLTSDLQKARSFIEALLPKPLLDGPVKTAWHFIPCATLGGDAFGYHQLDADRLAMYLLDVCGHGAGAAMLSVSAMNTIRRQSLPNVDFSDPPQVLQALNDVYQMDDHDGMYFSIWYGIYDRRDQTLTCSAGGHPPALLVDAKNHRICHLTTKSMAIGIMPTCRAGRETVTVGPGDRLYLFSDGVFEITTAAGEEWSLEQFEQVVKTGWAPVHQEAERLYGNVRDISREKDLDDDFSLVVFEFCADE